MEPKTKTCGFPWFNLDPYPDGVSPKKTCWFDRQLQEEEKNRRVGLLGSGIPKGFIPNTRKRSFPAYRTSKESNPEEVLDVFLGLIHLSQTPPKDLAQNGARFDALWLVVACGQGSV